MYLLLDGEFFEHDADDRMRPNGSAPVAERENGFVS
jgi:hypothetical protein